jgi:putative salt-induced outer membrane protein
MKNILMAAGVGVVLCASFAARAQDTSGTGSDATKNGGWSGSGEFGYASSRGNARSENANAKLGLNQENEYWKNSFFFEGLRSKGETAVTEDDGKIVNHLTTTANRYDGGASVGYKLDPRSYIVGALRYDHDDFGANLWQGTASIGYGYVALKNERTELSFEIGPGYKRYRPADTTVLLDGEYVTIHQDTKSEAVARGLVNFKYRLTPNTSVEDTLLVEAGAQNKYYQNDVGLSVSMTKKMALKLGYQVRYNSDVLPGIKHSDTLTTTNLVYNF